jgi:hypothetical protein
MGKKLVAIVVVILALVIVPAISAQATNTHEKPHKMKTLKCQMYMEFNTLTEDHWIGYVKGDINGKLEVWESDPYSTYFSPNGEIEYFFERFVLTLKDGTVITGNDAGVWSFNTFKWEAVGAVNSGTYKGIDLASAFVTESNGVTTDPSSSSLIKAWATFTISR